MNLRRPFDTVRSYRGLTAIATLKIISSLLIGYIVLSFSRILKLSGTSLKRRFGDNRINFISEIAKLQYVFKRSSDGSYLLIRTEWDDDFITSEPYELEVKRVFRPHRGEVVVDVGSHLGLYTIDAARSVGKDGLVISLEPNPANYKLLIKNLKLNGISNVVTLQLAAYESDGFSKMVLSSDSGRHSLVKERKYPNEEIIVPTITLDSLMGRLNLKRIDWTKIDVEGAELRVLKGAMKALCKIGYIIMEVWDENENEVFNILRERGYEITILDKYKGTKNILAERKCRVEE